MNFVVLGELPVLTDSHHGEDKLRQLREYTVIIVLTYRKIDIISADHILVEMADLLQVLPLRLVILRTVRILNICFSSKAIPQL